MKTCLACYNYFTASGWQCPVCAFTPEYKNGFACLAPNVYEGHTELDEESFYLLAHLESKSFWFRARNKIIMWAIKKNFPQAKSLLEIGCGTGFVLNGIAQEIPHLSIFGSELSIDGLKHAAGRVSRAELFQMDALKIPFSAEFDVIGAFDVLEHIESDHVVLSQMYKAIKPGGGIIVTVPQHKYLWSYFDEASRHFRRYSKQELQSKLEEAGFKVIMSTSFVSLLLPAVMASRLLVKQQSNEEITNNLQADGLANAFLDCIMDFEYRLIKSGLRFPFGSSLLMVGYRT